ncbi:MAG: hypothetical protein RLZZ324_252 [Candidatus Parcubacteria bacterium]|jgi:hypothetical protein
MEAEDVSDGETQIEAIARSFDEAYRVSPTMRRLCNDQGIFIDDAAHARTVGRVAPDSLAAEGCGK